MKIENVNIGWPIEVGTDLMVRVLPFETNATSCGLYYAITNENGKRLAEGNLQLSEEEFAAWGQDNAYIEDLTLAKLSLVRFVE